MGWLLNDRNSPTMSIFFMVANMLHHTRVVMRQDPNSSIFSKKTQINETRILPHRGSVPLNTERDTLDDHSHDKKNIFFTHSGIIIFTFSSHVEGIIF